MAQTTSPGSPAGPTAQEALMTTQTTPITPAVRFHADRIRRAFEPGSGARRALDKAQHIESRPANYTEPMLRWAEQVLRAADGNAWAELDALTEAAETAGWLA